MTDKLKKDKLKNLKPAKKGEVRNPFGSPGHGVKKTLAEYGYKPEEELMFIARMAMEAWGHEQNAKYLQIAKECNTSLLEYIQPKKKAQEVAPEKPRSPEESKAAAEDAFSLLKELEDGPIERTETEGDTDSVAPRTPAVSPKASAEEDLRHDHGHQGTDRGGELQPEAREDHNHGGDSHGDGDKDPE